MSAVLPPGLDATGFTAAMRAFAAVVGSEYALISEADLIPYHDAYGFEALDDHHPGGAVAPADVAELQAVLRIANERGHDRPNYRREQDYVASRATARARLRSGFGWPLTAVLTRDRYFPFNAGH